MSEHYIGETFTSIPPYSAEIWANENHALIVQKEEFSSLNRTRKLYMDNCYGSELCFT